MGSHQLCFDVHHALHVPELDRWGSWFTTIRPFLGPAIYFGTRPALSRLDYVALLELERRLDIRAQLKQSLELGEWKSPVKG